MCPSSGQPGAVAWIPALGSVSGSSCFLVLARQAWSRALPPWEHKVQRGQTTNTRVKRPNYNVTTHPLPSTLPASPLTAVTRHQDKCGQKCVMGRHTRSPPLSLQLWPAQQRRDRLLLCARRCGPLHIQLQWAHLLPIELTRAI